MATHGATTKGQRAGNRIEALFEKSSPEQIGEVRGGDLASLLIPAVGYAIDRWWLNIGLSWMWLIPFVPAAALFLASDSSQKREDGQETESWFVSTLVRRFIWQTCQWPAYLVTRICGLAVSVALIGIFIVVAGWIYEALSIKALLLFIAIALVILATKIHRSPT